MKKTTLNAHARKYPNAAQRQYRLSQALDCALTAAATVGLTVVLLFLIMI